jgi:hypothetical protein
VVVGILIAFALIFIIVLAFKPNTRTTRVKRIDEHGNKTVEYHRTHEVSAAGCAAKIVVYPILTLIIIAIVIILYTSR